jgi:hypothetical protein
MPRRAGSKSDRTIREDRHAFTRYIWDFRNPEWRVPDTAFAATARSFDNPDWAEVALHSYPRTLGFSAARSSL